MTLPLNRNAEGATDRERLEALYVAVEKPLYNVLYRYVWNAESAQDILQEAFLRLWGMREQLRWETAKPLVYKVALNLARSQRKRSARLTMLLREPASTHTTDAALRDSQRDRAVMEAIHKLPEKKRRVLLLTTFADLSYEEVAALVGVSEGTIASRRHAAIEELKRKVNKP